MAGLGHTANGSTVASGGGLLTKYFEYSVPHSESLFSKQTPRNRDVNRRDVQDRNETG